MSTKLGLSQDDIKRLQSIKAQNETRGNGKTNPELATPEQMQESYPRVVVSSARKARTMHGIEDGESMCEYEVDPERYWRTRDPSELELDERYTWCTACRRIEANRGEQ